MPGELLPRRLRAPARVLLLPPDVPSVLLDELFQLRRLPELVPARPVPAFLICSTYAARERVGKSSLSPTTAASTATARYSAPGGHLAGHSCHAVAAQVRLRVTIQRQEPTGSQPEKPHRQLRDLHHDGEAAVERRRRLCVAAPGYGLPRKRPERWDVIRFAPLRPGNNDDPMSSTIGMPSIGTAAVVLRPRIRVRMSLRFVSLTRRLNTAKKVNGSISVSGVLPSSSTRLIIGRPAAFSSPRKANSSGWRYS